MSNRSRNFIARHALMFLALVAFVTVPAFSRQSTASEVEILNTFATNNIVATEPFAFAAAGSQGIVVVDLATLTIANVVSPPAGTGTIDDLCLDGGLLFTLDGAGAGALSVFSIANPAEPTLVSGPVGAAVGPFAGVSASNGRVVVSGGTSLLSVRSYDDDGNLFGAVSSIDLGIGQPDVLVSDDGSTAYVSTDFAGLVNGQSFGITVIDISGIPTTVLDQIGIPGAGFSPGTSGPANFPIESALQGDVLFVAAGNGVSVIDVSNPASVQTITQIPLSTNPVNIDVFDDTLYVVGNSPSSTLTTIDISNLSSPVVETVVLPGNGSPLGVAATSTHVVVADDDLGVLVDQLFLLGDINRDGVVNLLDVEPFIALLSSSAFQAEADFNMDGQVNLLDIQPFVTLLGGG